MEESMTRPVEKVMPRIALGVTHVKQSLEELLSELEEPIAITVQGRRVAVLLPYAQYMALAGATAEEEPEEGSA